MSSIGNTGALAKQRTGEVLPLFPDQGAVPFEEPSQRHQDLEFLRRFRPVKGVDVKHVDPTMMQNPASMSALSHPNNFIAEGPMRGLFRRSVKKHGIALASVGFTAIIGAGALLALHAPPALKPGATSPARPPAASTDATVAVTTLTKTARDPSPPVNTRPAGPSDAGDTGSVPRPRIMPNALLEAAPGDPQTRRQSITDLPPPALAVPEPAKDTSADGPAGPVAERSPAEVRQLDTFVARGEQLLTAGEIVAARLFFQRAASQGDPRGARGLARSYDPGVLKGLPVLGLEGNRGEADRWYLKAADLETARAEALKGRTATR